MENVLGMSLQIVGVAMVALIVVLSAFAGLLYLITGVVKEKPEAEEAPVAVSESPAVAPVVETNTAKLKAAAIAVALARAQSELASRASVEENAESNPWRQFHRNRRLSQSLLRRAS